MRVWDEKNAEVLVYTYKEGLLAAAAHDLKLQVQRFRVKLADDGTLAATFDPRSLRVVCARRDGQDAPQALPAIFFGEIERNIEKDVLLPKRYPDIAFAAERVDNDRVTGVLRLHGADRSVRVTRVTEEDVEIGRARLDQRDFGIKPFTAMLGALKLKPVVDVEVRLQR